MADSVDLKGVVKHLVDGTFDQNLCRICLLPLGEACENIFTRICKEDKEYCIADILEDVCGIQFTDTDKYNVCTDCFLMASTSYKFYVMCKRSDEILHFYTEELDKNIQLNVDSSSSDTLCITLPEFTPSVENFDYDIEGCLSNEYFLEHDQVKGKKIQQDDAKNTNKSENIAKSLIKDDDDNLVVVIEETGQRTFYKISDEGSLVLVSNKTRVPKPAPRKMEIVRPEKFRKKRSPMVFTKCSQCPVKYRFLSKLQAHMRTEHHMDLFVCKICKTITEDKEEYTEHIATHTGTQNCDGSKTDKMQKHIIANMKWHEEVNSIPDMDSAHICELCGHILQNEEQLKDHYDKKHDKKHTCFYCGKMYKREISCEAHIRKHEMHMKKGVKRKKSESPVSKSESPAASDKRVTCAVCGNHFVDQRSLMWHFMLHTNERPYKCDVCARAFITVNRRNQHMLCAHTMPTKRCPLCPALFHLRSMVNSHIKKVHLKAHKRRHRSSKHQNMKVHWRTERVPIQELSVDIQSEILELRTQDGHEASADDPPY